MHGREELRRQEPLSAAASLLKASSNRGERIKIPAATGIRAHLDEILPVPNTPKHLIRDGELVKAYNQAFPILALRLPVCPTSPASCRRSNAGDPAAAEQLLPLVYDELRKLAAARLAQEKPGQTLQATALVHEAYLRLVGPGSRGT